MPPWLPWAVDDPAPGNCGYAALNIPCELTDRSLRRGVTIHSSEGYFTYINPSAVMRSRGNSWGVTIMRTGAVWRHRPRPTFVNWHAGGPAQNIGTDAIEMEGRDGEPWTPEQRVSLVLVLAETRDWFGWPAYTVGLVTNKTQEGIRRTLLALPPGSLWEHNWFDFTSCPSGRNDYGWLMPALGEKEDDMVLELAQIQPNGAVYALFGPFKLHLSPLANEAMMARGAVAVTLGDTDAVHNARLEALPDWPSAGAGGAACEARSVINATHLLSR